MQTKLTSTILGHVGTAAIKTENGKTFIQFTVCHNESYKNKDGAKVEKSTWVTCFKNLKEGTNLKIEKGIAILVTGELKVDVYKDAQGGYKAGLTLNNCDFNIIGTLQKSDPQNLQG